MLRVDGAEPAAGRMVLRGLARRCPLCGAGHLFRHWLVMEDRCPGCGHLFQRRLEDGFFLGAYMINLTFALVVLAAVLFLDVAREARLVHVPFWVVAALGAFGAVGIPLIGYPFSKTTWSAIDLAMHPPDVVERADAAAHHSA
jgi:uncharacterized protein (DUF983 family)